jgi:Ca2+-binding RTX toxin-like protein
MATFTGTAGIDVANATNGTLTGFTGGTLAELQDAIGDTFDGGASGADTIIAGIGDDIITGGADADEMRGGDGSDWFNINPGDVKVGEIIDGGNGGSNLDRIRLAGNVDLYNATITGIEQLEFLSTLGAASATLLASQTVGGALSTSLAVRGSGAVDTLTFDMGFSNTLDLSNYTFSSWTVGADKIIVNMDASEETITGSSQNDRFVSVGAFDVVAGGDGNDVFKLVAGSVTGRVIQGGVGTDDRLEVTSGLDFASGGYDLKYSALIGIERIDVLQSAGNYSYLGFSASQFFNGGELATNLHIENATNDLQIVVTMFGNTTLNLGGLTFGGTGHLSVDIIGDGDAETITGTSQNDRIWGYEGNDILAGLDGDDGLYGGATSDDTLIGGAGADIMYGNGGSDTFRVATGDVVGGEQIWGGSDGTNIDRILTTGSVDLQAATINGIERLEFENGGTVTVLADQLAALPTIVGSAGSNILVINVASGNYSLAASGTTFSNWSNGDIIAIYGSNGDNSLIGSSRDEGISGGAGSDTLDGGAGVDKLLGGAGNDTIFYDAADDLANVLGGADTDTLVFTSGAAPVSFNLVAHQFELAEGRITDTGANAWASYVDHYDSAWRKDYQTGLMDDGRTYYEDYDQLGNQTWSRITYFNDAQGRSDVESGQLDTGASYNSDLDNGNLYSWTRLDYWFDSLNRADTESGQLDDGRHYNSDIDNGNLYSWTRIDYWSDSLGRADVETGFLDDGRSYNSDLDNGNQFAWSRIDNWADSLGRLDYQNGVYDATDATHPGWTWQIDYDQANQFAWARVERFYNAAGVIQSETYF